MRLLTLYAFMPCTGAASIFYLRNQRLGKEHFYNCSNDCVRHLQSTARAPCFLIWMLEVCSSTRCQDKKLTELCFRDRWRVNLAGVLDLAKYPEEVQSLPDWLCCQGLSRIPEELAVQCGRASRHHQRYAIPGWTSSKAYAFGQESRLRKWLEGRISHNIALARHRTGRHNIHVRLCYVVLYFLCSTFYSASARFSQGRTVWFTP